MSVPVLKPDWTKKPSLCEKEQGSSRQVQLSSRWTQGYEVVCEDSNCGKGPAWFDHGGKSGWGLDSNLKP